MHEEAQETARRLAEEALSQDVRQHRQGLWHEQRLHRSSMEQECSIRYMHARARGARGARAAARARTLAPIK